MPMHGYVIIEASNEEKAFPRVAGYGLLATSGVDTAIHQSATWLRRTRRTHTQIAIHDLCVLACARDVVHSL